MKKDKIIFWTTASIIFLFEGVTPALTSQTEMAKEGIRHLGYPQYFGVALAVFKVLGSLALIIPQVPARVKEWAFAGFGFDFLFASISYFAVEGIGAKAIMPLAFFGLLAVCWVYYHKLKTAAPATSTYHAASAVAG